MVSEIHIYIEGDPQLRQGFRTFFQSLYDVAKRQNVKIATLKLCGSRGDTYKAFRIALKKHPNAFIVLLVDSEGAVGRGQGVWEYLRNEDGWDSMGTDDTHCYLMIQAMEAWFIADIDALGDYYGKGFQESAIPKNPKVEEIDKNSLESALKAATRNTLKKEYHKTRHASQILERLNVKKVRKAADNCDRLFTTLSQIMGETV
jgi:ribosomal protein S21